MKNTYRCIFYATIVSIHQTQCLLFLIGCIAYLLNQKSSNSVKTNLLMDTFRSLNSGGWMCFKGLIRQPKSMMTRIIAAVASMAPCQPKALISLEDNEDN